MKNTFFTSKIVVILSLVLLPLLSMAHGYWLETKGSGKVGEAAQIYLFYGEYAEHVREKGARLDKMAEIKIAVLDASGKKTDIAMKQTDTHWEGTFTPQTEGVYQIIGINETREVQDWTQHNLGVTRPVQYLRTAYTVGNPPKSTPVPQQFLDIVASRLGNQVLLEAHKDQQPLSKIQLTVINPEGWEKTKITNEKGKAVFMPGGKGLYLVALEWIDKTPGKFKDKNYETIRYRCDMSIWVD